MKKPTTSILLPALMAAFVSLNLMSAQAGFLDILRGNSDASPAVQRVAFIGSAKVKAVDGRAEKLLGIDKWTPLQPGVELKPGDLVRTAEGTVLLRMNESGSFIKVTPNTLLRLAALPNDFDKSVLSGCEERKGFVVRGCRGKAYARTATEPWKAVTVNSVLAVDTELRTEPGTVLDLFHTEKQLPLRIQGSTITKLQGNSFAARILAAPSLAAIARP